MTFHLQLDLTNRLNTSNLMLKIIEVICLRASTINETVEATTSSYSATGEFLRYSILYDRIIRISDQGI